MKSAPGWAHGPGNRRTLAEPVGEVLRRCLRRLSLLLDRPDYNWIWHPLTHIEDGALHIHWRLEVFPRLGRVAGFEWGTGAYLVEVGPELAAARLRSVQP